MTIHMTRPVGMMRGLLFRGTLALALGIGFSIAWAEGPAGTKRAPAIYTIVTNPGEDCSREMNISWNADLALRDCVLVYTRKSDSAWAEARQVKGQGERCEVFNGIASKTAANADWNEEAVFLDYNVTLTRLEPDTEYMYRIKAGGEGGPVSRVQHFKTARAEEFSFVWISDFHAYTPLPHRQKNAVKVLNAAIEIDPSVDFVFSTGDVVAWGGSYSFWRELYAQDFIGDYLFACVIGNHDDMTRTWARSPEFFRVVNHFPRNGYAGQEGVCYWFIYGDVLFINLNNEVMKTGPEAEQAAKDWAAKVIDEQSGRYKYIFLAEHYQWFDGRQGKTSWYANWRDFCDEHGVALALSGNNHCYQRTHPLSGNRVVPEGEGTVYMQCPSSDGERGVQAGKLTENADKLAVNWSSQVKWGAGVKTIGCVLVKVGAEGITTKLVYIDEAGRVHTDDEQTLSKPRKPRTAPAEATAE